jgi:transposase
MAREFLTGDRDQGFLLPPDLREWLPEDHLVWFVLEVVEELDLSGFAQRAADPRGRRRYDPALLVGLLIYAYCVGERSSRQIERRCREDVAFRVAAVNLAPDHTTIARFLKDHAAAFDGLFTQVLRLAAGAGLAKMGTVALDGTKVAADASPLAAMTGDRIAQEVARITDEARRVDAEEDERFGDARGDELPADLVDPRSRKARLAEAAEAIRAEDAANEARPASRKRTKPAKANVTDPQCRVMKGPHNYFPAYNAQAAASTDGIIIAADVTTEAVDNHQLVPLVDQACANADAVGLDRPDTVVADAGYFTNDNIDYRRNDDPDGPARPAPIIPPARDKRRVRIATHGPIPKSTTPAQIMERTLATKTGAALYKQRAPTIEAIFGNIKTGRGISRFRRRGLDAARHEWRLAVTTHNILKIWRHTTPAQA